MKQSLTEYAKNNPPSRGKTCYICGLPQREEIDNGFRSGLLPVTIREWLINECGISLKECTQTRVSYHYHRGHHEKSS